MTIQRIGFVDQVPQKVLQGSGLPIVRHEPHSHPSTVVHRLLCKASLGNLFRGLNTDLFEPHGDRVPRVLGTIVGVNHKTERLPRSSTNGDRDGTEYPLLDPLSSLKL